MAGAIEGLHTSIVEQTIISTSKRLTEAFTPDAMPMPGLLGVATPPVATVDRVSAAERLLTLPPELGSLVATPSSAEPGSGLTVTALLPVPITTPPAVGTAIPWLPNTEATHTDHGGDNSWL